MDEKTCEHCNHFYISKLACQWGFCTNPKAQELVGNDLDTCPISKYFGCKLYEPQKLKK